MKIALNFGWRFAPGFIGRYLDSLPENSEVVDLPHAPVTLPYHYFSEEDYQGLFTYEKIFDAEKLNGRLAFLHFDGVMLKVHVILNGADLGTKISGWIPVEFDITKAIKEKNNRLLVIVDSREDPSIPPFGKACDYLTFAGIYRPLFLVYRPQTYLDELFAYGDSKGHLSIQTSLRGNESGDITYRLFQNGKLIKEFAKNQITINDPLVWTLSAPSLYELEATFHGPEEDKKTIRFGFRDAKWTKDGFFLNGKRVELIGLNRHQNYPYVGPAMPASGQREDADILKTKIGCNLVRTSHYPQSEDFLNRCDELGLMVIDEIPGWQYLGRDVHWRAAFYHFLEGMAKKERNHPCLIAYGTRVDESADDDDLYSKAVEMIHRLDPYRPCLGVRNFKTSHCLEDIYAYNDFSCASLKHGLDNPKTIIGAKNKPILITEHNGHMFPTKQTDRPARRLEQALRHLRVMDDAYRYPRLAGAVGWCAFDYNTHKDFGSGDHICYHGVSDIFRNPKASAFAYASQSSPVPVMWIANFPTTGDYDEAKAVPLYVFTNCDYVEFYRNDKFIDVFKPDVKDYPHLPHPPVKIDDYIGALIKDERFSKRDGNLLKQLLNYVGMVGYNHIKIHKVIRYLPLLIRNHIGKDELVNLYSKYLSGWGEKAVTYAFKGYRSGKLVVEKNYGPSTQFFYRYETSSEQLLNGDTYDVCRVGVRYVDEWGSQLHYASNVLTLETEGPIDVIGPKEIALVGGDISIWVKSRYVANPQSARLIIHTDQGDKAIDFMVQ